MRKGCFVFVLGSMFLCLLVCIGIYFVGLPYLHKKEKTYVAQQFSTVVAQQIPRVKGTVQPGDYKVTDKELNDYLNLNLDSSSVDSASVHIATNSIQFTIKAKGGQESTYTGTPSVVNGQIQMKNMKTDNSALEFFLPADVVGDAIEKSVNDYLATNKVSLKTVKATPGLLTLTVAGPK